MIHPQERHQEHAHVQREVFRPENMERPARLVVEIPDGEVPLSTAGDFFVVAVGVELCLV